MNNRISKVLIIAVAAGINAINTPVGDIVYDGQNVAIPPGVAIPPAELKIGSEIEASVTSQLVGTIEAGVNDLNAVHSTLDRKTNLELRNSLNFDSIKGSLCQKLLNIQTECEFCYNQMSESTGSLLERILVENDNQHTVNL